MIPGRKEKAEYGVNSQKNRTFAVFHVTTLPPPYVVNKCAYSSVIEQEHGAIIVLVTIHLISISQCFGKPIFFTLVILWLLVLTSVLVIGGLDIIAINICRREELWLFSKSNSTECYPLNGF